MIVKKIGLSVDICKLTAQISLVRVTSKPKSECRVFRRVKFARKSDIVKHKGATTAFGKNLEIEKLGWNRVRVVVSCC